MNKQVGRTVLLFFLLLSLLKQTESTTIRKKIDHNTKSLNEAYMKISEKEWGNKILQTGKGNKIMLLSSELNKEIKKLEDSKVNVQVQMDKFMILIENLNGKTHVEKQGIFQENFSQSKHLNTEEEIQMSQLFSKKQTIMESNDTIEEMNQKDQENEKIYLLNKESIQKEYDAINDLYSLIEQQAEILISSGDNQLLNKQTNQKIFVQLSKFHAVNKEIKKRMKVLDESSNDNNAQQLIFFKGELTLLEQSMGSSKQTIHSLAEKSKIRLQDILNENIQLNSENEQIRKEQQLQHKLELQTMDIKVRKNAKSISHLQSKQGMSFIQQWRNQQEKQKKDKKKSQNKETVEMIQYKLKKVQNQHDDLKAQIEELNDIKRVVYSRAFQSFLKTKGRSHHSRRQ